MSDSYLSSLSRPFDMVVATTQMAINGTMLEYLAGGEIEEQYVCFVWGEQPEGGVAPQLEIKRQDLKADPFSIPHGAVPRKNADLQALVDQGFSCAMLIKPGIPNLDSGKFPNVIELGSDASNVKYNMLCEKFQICQLAYGPRGSVQWSVFEQPSGEAWGFTSSVDLRLSPLDDSKFAKLPKEVQDKIMAQNLGANGFSVSQLLFDLDNAAMQTQPSVQIISAAKEGTRLDPLVVGIIDQSFMNIYWAQQHAKGQPLFHVAVTSTAPEQNEFRPTSVNRQVCPLVDANGQPVPYETLNAAQRELTTMNYLCMSFNHSMPPAQKFQWNWMSERDSSDYHGIVAYCRNSFAQWLGTRMAAQVKRSCKPPYVNLPQHFGHVTYNIRLGDNTEDAVLEYPPWQGVDSPVLRFTYSPTDAHDGAGDNTFNHYSLAEAALKTSYKCEVFFKGREIRIEQEQVVNLWIEIGKTDWGGDIVHKKLSVTYPLDVDAHGNMARSEPKPTFVDASQSPDVNRFENFFTDINPIINKIKDQAYQDTCQFGEFPIALAQGFHFPGGKVFAFKNFQFSKYHDLTAQITYADPTFAR